MNLADLFAIAAARDPDKAAVRFEAAGAATATLSYRQLGATADRLAAGFAARGVHPEDRVAVYMGNRPTLVVVHLALLRLGAVMVPINLAYRRREIAHILADAEPRLLVTEESQLPILGELTDPAESAESDGDAPPAGSLEPTTATRRAGIETVTAEELEGWGEEAGASAASSSRAPGGDDLALLLYTSGTTGPSKGALLTHNNLLATVTGLLAAWAWRPADVLLLALPLFHTHGLVVGLDCALAAGATVVLHRRFDAATVLARLTGTGAATGGAGEEDASAPTLFFGVPTMYVRLVEALRATRAGDARRALSRMRLFCSGSAPLSPETFAAFRDLAGHEILERYGMTETGMNLSNPYAGERRPGTVGTPLPGVSIRIVDAAGEEVSPGEAGLLLARGSNVCDGYWRAPEKTRESFTTDELGRRWFRTGDLARQDPASGHVTLLGRESELVISGGFNIYPREVEEVLTGVPGVLEAAVVGAPDAEWGEVPVAFVVAGPELPERDRERLGEVLAERCRAQIAAFKVPKRFHRLEALPRNALGKIQKHLLREPVGTP